MTDTRNAFWKRLETCLVDIKDTKAHISDTKDEIDEATEHLIRLEQLLDELNADAFKWRIVEGSGQ